MEEYRYSWRFPTNLKAFYFPQGEKGSGRECTVINVSRNGAGLEFYTSKKVGAGTKLHLEIVTHSGEEPIAVEGSVRWIKQGKRDFVCGIALREMLDRDTLSALGVC